jgi:hypothetical protein
LSSLLFIVVIYIISGYNSLTVKAKAATAGWNFFGKTGEKHNDRPQKNQVPSGSRKEEVI